MPDLIESKLVSKYFLILALINTIAAICFTLPILIPTSGLPLIIGAFPGTWLLIAFLVHVTVGILGMVGWAGTYYISSRVMNKKTTNKLLARGHLFVTALGVYVTTTFFALAGFIGGRAMIPETGCVVLVDQCMGAGVAIVQTLITFTVIPTGAGMGLALTGTAIGILNILVTLRQEQ